MVKERLDGLVDEVRSTLRPERIGYRDLGVRGNAVTFTLTDPAAAPRALELLRKLDQSVGLSRELVIQEAGDGRIEIRLTDDAVQEMQRAAVTQSLEIVRRRIDEVGTREPTIQRQGNDRILVQVPGEKDPESIKRLLGQTAKLTFHLVDLETPVQQALAGNLPPGSELLPRRGRWVGPGGGVRGAQAGRGQRREPGRRPADLPRESARGQLPLRLGRAGASSATSPAITSASCWRSCSTTR